MKYLIIYLLALMPGFSSAQVIGDFTLTDVRNGNDVTLSAFTNSKAVVVIFTNTKCPYDEYYSGRMRSLVADYRNRDVQLLFINSSPEESPEDLKNHGDLLGAPYLDDRQQVVMRLLDAGKSPEAFILIPVNGGFRKLYQGAIDNNPQVATDVKKPYLRQNLDNVLSGESLTYANIPPVGCRIRIP